MKYLKVYEEFEPKDSVKEDIKDIFIELTIIIWMFRLLIPVRYL